MSKKEDVISIPRSVLLTVASLDELEDWLQAQDPEFIAELRRIRDQESLTGKGFTTDELRKEWGIPS